MTCRSVTILCLSAAILAPVAAPAQKTKGKIRYKPEYWKTDPYTGADPAVMKRAGYVSFGPFTWGDDHGTPDILKMFPNRKVLCLETKHFKIVSTLPPYKVPKGRKLEKKLLKEQLTRLRITFPKIKPTARLLDPWLRVHLFAHRLEATYANVCTHLRVTDSDFPQKKSQAVVGRGRGAKYMGQGPYLGMRGKFLIMLLQTGADLNRYAARAKPGFRASGTSPEPVRHYFTKVGSLYFGTNNECGEGSLYNDHALHCHVVFNTVHSMVDGYKDFYFALPVWIREGLGHWYVRNIDPKEHTFTGMKGRSHKKRYDPKWDVKIRRRVKHGDFTPAAEVCRYMSFSMLEFRDHMAVWSRLDFLLSLGDEKFAKFMSILKNRIDVRAGLFPKPEQVWAQQDEALKTAYGFDPAGFDTAWRAYVLKTYPTR